jgi:hypothetical protein
VPRSTELDVPRERLRVGERPVPRGKLHRRRADERGELPRGRPNLSCSGDEGLRALRMRRDGLQDELYRQHGLLGGELVQLRNLCTQGRERERVHLGRFVHLGHLCGRRVLQRRMRWSMRSLQRYRQCRDVLAGHRRPTRVANGMRVRRQPVSRRVQRREQDRMYLSE